MISPLVVVHNLNAVNAGMLFIPTKADAPLIVDANAVLPFAVTAQGLQMIPRRGTQVHQCRCRIESLQTAACCPFDGREAADELAGKEAFRIATTETSYHPLRVSRFA